MSHRSARCSRSIVIAGTICFGLSSLASAQTCTTSLTSVGQHAFIVPPSVASITIEAYGARGGDIIGANPPFGSGGLGGGATGAVIPVTAGETLEVFVGGRGVDIAAGGGAVAVPGGFHGGGSGAPGTAHTGAPGGGASEVRRGATSLLIVGGGGGGAHGGNGGAGGQLGTDGVKHGVGSATSGLAGGNGGAGGTGNPSPLRDGAAGAPGAGGNGGGDPTSVDGGGGGGAGFVGGGGGAGGPGNGGTGGGGGSSFGPAGTAFATGADAGNAGDGRVAIVWPCQADITLDKTAALPNPLIAGETITYNFSVQNTGNVQLTNVAVVDPLPGLTPVACLDSVLDPSEQTTCSATYQITPGDVQNGTINNTAEVTGDPVPPEFQQNVTDQASALVSLQQPVPAMPLAVMLLLVTLLGATGLWMLDRKRAAMN